MEQDNQGEKLSDVQKAIAALDAVMDGITEKERKKVKTGEIYSVVMAVARFSGSAQALAAMADKDRYFGESRKPSEDERMFKGEFEANAVKLATYTSKAVNNPLPAEYRPEMAKAVLAVAYALDDKGVELPERLIPNLRMALQSESKISR